ncbi:hypothetical protein [Streptomyces sp. NPDC052042]|uniref:DUF7927 domain-containing protein n=1 Tax=Streptomyces sp. NPDC052042 TaxID=3365683 RepID=UPI0037CF7691
MSLSLALALILPMFSQVTVAWAKPVHQITGRWAGKVPAQLAAGEVVTAEWRVNINDDEAAPSNELVDNVTFKVTLQHGTFDAIPDACLTKDVTPASSLSADKATLTCNLGTQQQGTAVVVQTPIVADGENGDEVSATGTIGGESAQVPPIPIRNAFGMDMVWGTPTNAFENGDTYFDVDFEWTLNLKKGSEAGPDSVSYILKVTPPAGSVQVGPRACEAFSAGAADGHPWSGGSHPAGQMAPFVKSCTVTPTGNANEFKLTLTGIDYSQAKVPTKDSAGEPLPTDRVVVASGSVWFRLMTTQVGATKLESSAPTYTSVSGQTAQDDPSNNTSSKVVMRAGAYVGQWSRWYTGSGGTSMDDTYRVSPGTRVNAHAVSGLATFSMDPNTKLGMCVVLDTKYTTFESAEWTDPSLAGIPTEYYVGDSPSLNPNSGSYNPEAFSCGTGGDDLGAAGWVTTVPADLSTVKAIRSNYLHSDIRHIGTNIALGAIQQIKPGTPVGTDVWTFKQYRQPNATWAPINGNVTATPGARYAATTPSRDILRVIGVGPFVEKSADRSVLRPGDAATYTLTYSANGQGVAPPTVDGYKIVDTLPVGMLYVSGSADPEPAVTTDGNGQQVLTWALNGVTTNTQHTLTYQASATDKATPGKTLVNSAVTSVNGQNSRAATATVTVPVNGLTTIGKSADAAFIPNVKGDGKGSGSWTVTLRSYDPVPQEFTDTIDILPYKGDGRGTSYSGSYKLESVTPEAGAKVYYTTAAPGSLSDDPDDKSNGKAGDVTGNTVGWTQTFTPDATAVRVIGPSLDPGARQQFKVAVATDGAKGGDKLVNRAQARDGHTELVMRTSAPITVANYYSASLKKFVQDKDGQWHDANEAADYPAFKYGDTVKYRIVVTNTGQGTLKNVKVSDDKFPELGAFTIDSLEPGKSQSHEFSTVLDKSVSGTFVNTASATADTPPDSEVPPTIPPDPAGIEVTNYKVEKTADPASGQTVAPGDKVTYTVKVTQQGSAPADASFSDDLSKVLDDATYNDDVKASTGTAEIKDGVLTWNGTVPVGGEATITYSVTVKAGGDAQLVNTVLSPGCEVNEDGSTPSCTTHHELGSYTFSKSSDPKSGSTVQVGDKITYTVTVNQHGKAGIKDATITDDLSKVLDDATYNSDVKASSGTAEVKDGKLVWKGDLPVGGKVTITYSVTVTGGGDSKLHNVVTTDDKRGHCDAEKGCETDHVYGSYVFSKSSDPKSGSTVQVGDKVTYTVTVAQKGAGDVKNATVVDDLSKVLDDATYNDDVKASAGSAEVKDGKLVWKGNLPVGAKATITYSVTVTGGGDTKLHNVVTTDDKRGHCEQEDGCETDHVYGSYVFSKSSDPKSGSTVQVGDKVTYTVTVAQKGAGDVKNATVVDDLSKVLDDATYNDDVKASAGSAEVKDGKLVWKGNLPVGAKATITYSVTVTGGGDTKLHNVVTTPDERGTCDAEKGCETDHVYGSYVFSKSSDPKSGTAVKKGDNVTYTVAVAQKGAGEVKDATITDDLSKVLDDATYNDDVKASAGSAEVKDGKLVWKGDLPVDGKVTITYSVTVTGSGDGQLHNVVTTPDNKRGTCEKENGCETDHAYGAYTFSKSSDPKTGSTVQVGDKVTYTVTVNQHGKAGIKDATVVDDLSKVLDDATYNSDVKASSGTAEVKDGKLVWKGDLPVGGKVTITYSVTVTGGGDSKLHNVVTTDDKRGTCETEKACETDHVYGSYIFSKSSDPKSGSTVQVGDKVTYTVTVAQKGAGDVKNATVVDDLSKVLDDATYNSDVKASSGTAEVKDGKLVWKGNLPVDGKVTITYSVTVTGGGDSKLHNAVTTDDKRGHCETEKGCETDHVYGSYVFSKSSDPKTGTAVKKGDEVTYTVTVAQKGAGGVKGATVTDDLSKVLDDAAYNDDAKASSGDVSVSDGKLVWKGDLPVGGKVTITYSVTVNANGDGQLHNVVTTPDDKRGTCEKENGCETDHAYGAYTFSKSSDPKSGSTVQVGDKITYTVTVNQHGKAAIKDATITDDLSKVLDDAAYNDDAKASAGDVSVSDGKLVWKGDLPVGGKATITYSVTVTGGGDSKLHNVVTTPDDKRGTCETEKGCETDHVYGSYIFSKSSDPKTGTAVKKGDKVTYTVTVVQKGAGDVKDATITDDLSKVLDDAAYNDDAKASSGDVTVSDGKLVWKGNLPVDGKATITYSVTVTGSGDGLLHNVVTTPDNKRGTCDTEKGCETDHTVPPGKTPPPSTNVPPSGNIPPSGIVPPPNNPQPAPQSSGILARTGTTVLSAAALGTLLILGGLSLAVALRRRQRHNN